MYTVLGVLSSIDFTYRLNGCQLVTRLADLSIRDRLALWAFPSLLMLRLERHVGLCSVVLRAVVSF